MKLMKEGSFMELMKSSALQYAAVSRACTIHEESLDAIVPDTFPDIEAVCCALGSMEIREKLVQTDRVMVSGNIRCALVYRGESGGPLCALECAVPFAALAEARGCRQQDVVFTKASLLRVEGRMLNPRKFSIRAEFCLETQVCALRECQICEGAEGRPEEGIETLVEQRRFDSTVCMREKSLSIHEDVRLTGEGCGGEDRVLRSWAELTTEDVRVISNKVMLRGAARGEALVLRQGAGTMAKESFSLPFSQIIELENAEDGDIAEVEYCLKSCQCAIVEGGEGPLLQCDLAAEACVRVRREICKNVLLDAFSTAYACQVKQGALEAPAAAQKIGAAGELRLTLDTPERACAIADFAAAVKSCSASGADGAARAVLCVSLIYYNEQNQPCQHIQTAECEARFAGGWAGECLCACDLSGLAVSCSDGAAQLSGAVNFTVSAPAEGKTVQVEEFQLLEEEPKEKKSRASLILRRAQGGETVWQLSKRFNASPQQIMAANRLEDQGPLEPGALVMIPF